MRGCVKAADLAHAWFPGLRRAGISTITTVAAGLSSGAISRAHAKAMAALGAAKLERASRQCLRTLR